MTRKRSTRSGGQKSKRKIHNRAPEAKAEIRKRLVEELGGPKKCRVLETHSGPGIMRKLAYPGVADWLGIDSDPKSTDAVHADNRLVLRAMSLQPFNLFDVDALGAPWHQVWLIAQRRKLKAGERIGLAITSGMSGSLGAFQASIRAAGWSRQMQDALGAKVSAPHRWFVGKRFASETAQRLILAWFRGCKIELWLSGRARTGAAWYFGCALRGAKS